MNCEITEGNIRRGLTFRGSEAHVPTTDFSLGDGCLFCGKPEKSYTPDKHIEFICGTCVIKLADADQDDLKLAYKKALDQGYLRKASALESFIIPEETHAKRPTIKSIERSIDRKGIVRTVRVQERAVRQDETNQTAAVLQN